MSEERRFEGGPKIADITMVSGVIKVDFRAAGYPDLLKVAKEWAQDPCFYHLVVRSVSEDNFGIQFMYIKKNANAAQIAKRLRDDMIDRFGRGDKGVYSWDINESGWNTSDLNESISEFLIVQKEYATEHMDEIKES